jgi:hypothetical protein
MGAFDELKDQLDAARALAADQQRECDLAEQEIEDLLDEVASLRAQLDRVGDRAAVLDAAEELVEWWCSPVGDPQQRALVESILRENLVRAVRP